MAMLHLYHVTMVATLVMTSDAGFLQSQSGDNGILVGTQAKATFGADVQSAENVKQVVEAKKEDKLVKSASSETDAADEKYWGALIQAEEKEGAISFIQMLEHINDDDLMGDSAESEAESHAMNEAANNDDGEDDEDESSVSPYSMKMQPDEEVALLQKDNDDDDDDESAAKTRYDAAEYVDVEEGQDEEEEDEHPSSHEEEDEDEGAASFLQVGTSDDGDEGSDESGVEEDEEDTVASTESTPSRSQDIAEMDANDRALVTDEKDEEQINEELETQQEENEAASNNE